MCVFKPKITPVVAVEDRRSSADMHVSVSDSMMHASFFKPITIIAIEAEIYWSFAAK